MRAKKKKSTELVVHLKRMARFLELPSMARRAGGLVRINKEELIGGCACQWQESQTASAFIRLLPQDNILHLLRVGCFIVGP